VLVVEINVAGRRTLLHLGTIRRPSFPSAMRPRLLSWRPSPTRAA
jgi:hypothetical protein